MFGVTKIEIPDKWGNIYLNDAFKDEKELTMTINAPAIKNPLTIIAIFAGLSEISGTVVLPFINQNLQYIFIWFLMIFPVLLVVFFFFVLIFKHEVLYAPSDFKNEDNFCNLSKKATPATQVEISQNIQNAFDENTNDEYKVVSEKSNKEKLYNELVNNPKLQYFVAEELAFKNLKLYYAKNIQTQMALEFNKSRYVFDAVLLENDRIELFEIKYFSSEKMPLMGIGKSHKYFTTVYNDYIKENNKPFKVNYVVITPANKVNYNLMKQKIMDVVKDGPYKYDVLVYNYYELENKFGINIRQLKGD